ncbi:lysostaphin resistance A-like protein [Peptacetobacter sp. AB800]|uniref:CPBP family intramembrane glutamic endopeptidase n=1 Tax=Peptacetobacter sp. AB800 TaxID=3388428 RepID=UPI0039FDBCAE
MSNEYSEKVKGINLLIALISYLIFSFIHSKYILNTNIRIMIEIIFVSFVIIYLYKIKDIDIKNLRKWENLKYIAIGVLLLRVVAYGGTYLGEIILQEKRIENDLILQSILNQSKGMKIIEFYLYSIIFIPIIEEFVYRYVIIGTLGKMSKISMLISSAIFTSMHMTTNIIHWLTFFFMGMILAIIYKKTEKIETSMLAHSLNNLLAFIMCI